MADISTPLPPIVLDGKLVETIWGGSSLADIAGKAIERGATIGESWETATDTVAQNAPWMGMTLGEITARHGETLLGSRAVAVFGERFPLLAKFLDAREQLSVQVHPDDQQAQARSPGKLGKTEAWYILRAEPGAEIVYGVRRPVSAGEVREAIAATHLEDLLLTAKVQVGDVIFVPAGTIHAIGAGIVLYELQEYSDITYRLYDYGRVQADGKPRELHVEAGIAVSRLVPPAMTKAVPVTLVETQTHTERVLAACRYFVEEELILRGALAVEPRPSSCEILSVIEGACEVTGNAGGAMLRTGQTAVLAASLGERTLSSTQARLIRSWVPEEADAALAAWRAAQPAPVLF
ncbi:MAG TPA: type I phosphomannose isomerase catalytic subunit [Ktedonobacterales bacterium]